MRVPRLITRLLSWLAVAAAALVVLFAAIQTGPAKRVLASLGGTFLSGGGISVTISDLEGFIPTNMRVGAVTLADRQGEFARMKDLRLVWHPLALLSATISPIARRSSATRIGRPAPLMLVLVAADAGGRSGLRARST